MSRKATKAALVSVTLAFALLGTACAPSPVDTFTGEVSVESTDIRKKNCYAHVILPDGQKDTIKIGRRVSCHFDKGSIIKVVNGDYVK